MGEVKLAIPLFGKMAARSFHTDLFRKTLKQHSLVPVYFVAPHYFRVAEFDSSRHFELKTDQYDELLRHKRLLRWLANLRRFLVRTETTDLRFRESIEGSLFNNRPVARAWIYASYTDVLRRVPGLARLAASCENAFFQTHVHDSVLHSQAVDCVLTPGIGNYGFWNEGMFAREAKHLGLPVFSAITNYDNIVNRGYRGFMPYCLAVWSKQMADEAMRLLRIPARRIEITGPVQYDRFFNPIPISREEFLRSKGLDPARKTILYAGGVNVSRYFEIYRLLVDPKHCQSRFRCNVVIRPYPHPKVLSAPEWKFLEELLAQVEGLYLSNPLPFVTDGLRITSDKLDLRPDQDLEEMHGWLKYSDVLINHFSTISLEAAICDLPAIHIGYDVYTYGRRYNTSAAFQQRQTHNRRELRLAAAKVAKDEADLIKYIDLYLGDRTIDREARYEYALSECGYLDGLSSERLVAVLQSRMGL